MHALGCEQFPVRASFEPHETRDDRNFRSVIRMLSSVMATPSGERTISIPPLFKGCMQTECKSTSAHSRIDTSVIPKTSEVLWYSTYSTSLTVQKSGECET